MLQYVTRVVRAICRRMEGAHALATARRDSLLRLRDVPVSRVLVVCYGNIYRSAFVDAFLAAQPITGVEVRSAGLHPVANRESPPRHVAMSRRHGVDLRSHRSRALAQSDLEWAELIVLMDRHNWQNLVELGADRQRLVWLGALDDGAIEIPDPYGMDDAKTERIVARLAECSSALAARLASPRPQARGG